MVLRRGGALEHHLHPKATPVGIAAGRLGCLASAARGHSRPIHGHTPSQEGSAMLVEINTDNHIKCNADFAGRVEGIVASALERFGSRVTRAAVHFSDENSRAKSSDADKRCAVEARLAGLQPVTVTATGSSLEQALDSALSRLEKTLARTIERRDAPKGRVSFAGEGE
jgi:ribosome-associated translation inhibitor RaiA